MLTNLRLVSLPRLHPSAFIFLALLLTSCGSIAGLVAEPALENPGEVAIIAEGASPIEAGHLQAEPGGRLQLALARQTCCVFWDEIDAQPAWAISPSYGARIDPDSGLLSIDAAVAAGSAFTVTASLGGGEQVFETVVTIFAGEENPLVGQWRETAQISCANGAELAAGEPIGELIFSADGSLSVTWQPFEAYVDYVGEYHALGGTLVIEPQKVNYLPATMDESGNYRIDQQGRLRLDNFWLGAPPQNPAAAAQCGHIFVAR